MTGGSSLAVFLLLGPSADVSSRANSDTYSSGTPSLEDQDLRTQEENTSLLSVLDYSMTTRLMLSEEYKRSIGTKPNQYQSNTQQLNQHLLQHLSTFPENQQPAENNFSCQTIQNEVQQRHCGSHAGHGSSRSCPRRSYERD